MHPATIEENTSPVHERQRLEDDGDYTGSVRKHHGSRAQSQQPGHEKRGRGGVRWCVRTRSVHV